MKAQLRHRLLGAVVLTALAVIFVPLIIEEKAAPIEIENIFPEPKSQTYNEVIKEDFTPVKVPEETTFVPIPVIPPTPEVIEYETAPIIEQPTPKQVIDPNLQAWILQVGSFSNQNNAANLVAKLNKKGLEAFMEKMAGNKRTLYRVRVGPETNKNKIIKIQKKVQKIVNIKGRVMRYP